METNKKEKKFRNNKISQKKYLHARLLKILHNLNIDD